MMQALVACIFCSGTALQAADLNLCWTGAEGFTMTGRMTVPDAAMTQVTVTQHDVTRFKIAGYHEGSLLGTWNMADVQPDTTWFLRFHPATMTFPTGGPFASDTSQGWNANGDVTDCGNPGFGFNSGNYAQDICVNGIYIRASSIAPDIPLIATTAAFTPDCNSAIPTSKSDKHDHTH
jgi:hypothetical protein